MTPAELTERLDQVAVAEVGSLNRPAVSDEGYSAEQIDVLESPDRDHDPVVQAERREAKERFRRGIRMSVHAGARSRCAALRPRIDLA